MIRDDPAGPTLAPAARLSLSEAVANQLADVILRGEWGPGDRLPAERELAQRLQVSRIVVREALAGLVERGLVKGRPGVGTFVVRMERSAVTRPLSLFIRRHEVRREHLVDVREVLEPAIAAAAARRADEDDLAALRDALDRTEALACDVEGRRGAARDEAVEAFAWADLAFHALLARAGDNPLYEVLLSPLIDRLLDVRREGARLPGTARRAHEGHARVLERVTARDAAGAAAAMGAHLAEVASWSPAEPPTEPPTGPPTAPPAGPSAPGAATVHEEDA